jgi:hypothetical protein
MINRRAFPWWAIPRRTTGELGTAIPGLRPCPIATVCTLAIAMGMAIWTSRGSRKRACARGRNGLASRRTATQASEAFGATRGPQHGAS